MLVLFILLPAVYGLSSSEFDDYQINVLKPEWISVTNVDGILNVTVDYQHNSLVREAECFWWVNGRLLVDGEDNFRVNNFKRYRNFDISGVYRNTYNLVNERVKRASVLIPPHFDLQSLQLQLISDLLDIFLDINVIPVVPGKSLLEYIPEYKMTVEPKDQIIYDRGDALNFVIHFTAKGLSGLTYEEVKAKFVSMDPCITPKVINVKTSDNDNGFLAIDVPNWDEGYEDLSYRYLIYLDNLDHKIRRLNVTYSSADLLPRGILKVQTGYRSRSSCRLFGGISIARSVFLKPPPHENEVFFPDNSVAFLETSGTGYTDYGGNIEVSVTAFGSKLEQDRWYDEFLSHPEIYVTKNGRNVTAIADVKSLFQREIVFRFRNVNASDSGTYLAVAKVGFGRAKMTFNIYVQNIPLICGEQPQQDVQISGRWYPEFH